MCTLHYFPQKKCNVKIRKGSFSVKSAKKNVREIIHMRYRKIMLLNYKACSPIFSSGQNWVKGSLERIFRTTIWKKS